MTQIDTIYNALLKRWKMAKQTELIELQGSTTRDVAAMSNTARTTASTQLNKLVNAGRVVKVQQYPVRYIPTSCLTNLGVVIPSNHVVSQITLTPSGELTRDPFSELIGNEQSLAKAIAQAKAAVSYPPHGLHMLFLGPTGAGKTFFAQATYEHAKATGALPIDAPFIRFNCADYFDNTQLLLSQLFGYTKGAFTGANEESLGLLDAANNGILLLDEIHRLPPAGQEMLFTFMDTGTYARLGDASRRRKANVLIIAATTENPKSNLLATFVRRIPSVIPIPSLEEKGLREQIQILKHLFRKEAARIQRDIDVQAEVFQALLQAPNYGNIGELSTRVQLLCARAFISCSSSYEDIHITTKDLPDDIKQFNTFEESETNQQITSIIPAHVVLTAKDQDNTIAQSTEIYDSLSCIARQLQAQGYSASMIRDSLTNTMSTNIVNGLADPVSINQARRFISPHANMLTVKLKELTEQALHMRFDDRFDYHVGIHLDTYLRYGREYPGISHDIETIFAESVDQPEYQIANDFSDFMITLGEPSLPGAELMYLTLLLQSLQQLPAEGMNRRPGILIVAHGKSTASSMADVAKELFEKASIGAVDMPLNISPLDLLPKIISAIERLDQGRGVLLLVDMGSLSQLQQQIERRTTIPVQIIPYVTTLMVLDAVKKSTFSNLNLESLYHSVSSDFVETIQSTTKYDPAVKPKLILAVCITGTGTAERLKTILVNIIKESTVEAISVMTVSALTIEQDLPRIQSNAQVLALVGTAYPASNLPFVSLEQLLAGDGERIIQQIIHSDSLNVLNSVSNNSNSGMNIVPHELCLTVLGDTMSYLNPQVVTTALINWLRDLSDILHVHWANGTIVKAVVHTSYAFERVPAHQAHLVDPEWSNELNELLQNIQTTLAPYERQFQLELPLGEYQLITELIHDELVPSAD